MIWEQIRRHLFLFKLFVGKSTGLSTLSILSLLTFLMTSCGPRMSSQVNEYLSYSLEVAECTTNYSYASSLVLQGTAVFKKRETVPIVSNSKLSNMILGDPLTTDLPIPYAEVAIYNGANQIVQCGKTDSTGALKATDGTSDLIIPAIAQMYTVKVFARTRTTLPNTTLQMSGSVKKDIYRNEVYSIQTSFTSNGSVTPSVTLTAYARQTESESVEGGAFNIYNDFVQSYLFLDDKLNGSGISVSCLANPLNIFWKAGFNPYQYLEPTADPSTLTNTSFYQQSTQKLFITGGQLGDMSLSNTDHFDDFATIHEIGHFIEHQCGQFLTPGGNHALIVRIDPRLAWHEGWSNFFATSVLNDRLAKFDPNMSTKLTNASESDGWTFLNNTIGFADSVQNTGTGSGFLIDFKKAGTNPGSWQNGIYKGLNFDQINSSYPGEGHFREGAISRGLYKITHTCTEGTCASSALAFSKVWKAMDAITGIGQTAYTFTSSHDVLENIKTQVGGATWSSTYKTVAEADTLHLYSDQTGVGGKFISTLSATDYINWVPFGRSLTTGGSCNLAIQPRTDDPYLTGTNSDQRYSNHFYTIDTSTLTGLDSITITFTKDTSTASGTNVDHDLIVFNSNYVFNDDYGCLGTTGSDGSCSGTYYPIRTTTSDVVTANRYSSSNLGTSYSKTISGLSSLLAANSKYLLDIRSYTANKTILGTTIYRYSITSNLGALCP